MLFIIDQSVAHLLESNSDTQADLDCLDCLAIGPAEGSHRIGGSRRVLKMLSEHPGLQRRTRGVFDRAVSRVATEGNLQYSLPSYGIVVANDSYKPASENVGSKRTIIFPLRWFDSTIKVQPTVLLGEDLSDAKILRLVGETGTVLARLPYLPLALWPDHGGGSKTGQVLASNAVSNRPCVCIVDSDRASPSGAIGGTASGVQLFKDTSAFPLVEVAETSGRDLENILPDNFYRDSYGNNARHSGLALLLERLTHAQEIELRSHIDIEKGVTLRQVFNHPVGSIERAYWDGKLPILLSLLGTQNTSYPCLATGTCAQALTTSCSCVIVTGNTSNVLDHFLDRFAGANRYQIASSLDVGVRHEWLRLGGIVSSWCCGDDPLRI